MLLNASRRKSNSSNEIKNLAEATQLCSFQRPRSKSKPVDFMTNKSKRYSTYSTSKSSAYCTPSEFDSSVLAVTLNETSEAPPVSRRKTHVIERCSRLKVERNGSSLKNTHDHVLIDSIRNHERFKSLSLKPSLKKEVSHSSSFDLKDIYQSKMAEDSLIDDSLTTTCSHQKDALKYNLKTGKKSSSQVENLHLISPRTEQRFSSKKKSSVRFKEELEQDIYQSLQVRVSRCASMKSALKRTDSDSMLPILDLADNLDIYDVPNRKEAPCYEDSAYDSPVNLNTSAKIKSVSLKGFKLETKLNPPTLLTQQPLLPSAQKNSVKNFQTSFAKEAMHNPKTIVRRAVSITSNIFHGSANTNKPEVASLSKTRFSEKITSKDLKNLKKTTSVNFRQKSQSVNLSGLSQLAHHGSKLTQCMPSNSVFGMGGHGVPVGNDRYRSMIQKNSVENLESKFEEAARSKLRQDMSMTNTPSFLCHRPGSRKKMLRKNNSLTLYSFSADSETGFDLDRESNKSTSRYTASNQGSVSKKSSVTKRKLGPSKSNDSTLFSGCRK